MIKAELKASRVAETKEVDAYYARLDREDELAERTPVPLGPWIVLDKKGGTPVDPR